MSVVRIAFPVTRIKSRLTLNKGRPWSVVEHLILEALARNELSAQEIEEGFRLPRRLVNEALIRLMEIEWIQMRVAPETPARFVATAYGAEAATQEVLPHPVQRVVRIRTQIIDRLTGHVFRPSELKHIRREDLDQISDGLTTLVVAAQLPEGMYRADELLEVVLEDDEQLLNVDSTGEYGSNRLAVVQVGDGKVSGLPMDRSVEDLRGSLLRAATQAHPNVRTAAPLPAREAFAPPAPRRYRVRFEPSDLVMGGSSHHQAIVSLLGSAVSRVIIHSTFLDPKRFRNLLPCILEAVKRGVTVTVLFGEDEKARRSRPDRLTAREAAEVLSSDPQIALYRERLRIHPQSTHSHAKVILADRGQPGSFIALVGSCNWLSSPFRSIEESIYVREPVLVGEVARCLLRLTRSSSGIWSALASDLLRIVERMAEQPAAASPNAQASLVIGQEHNAYMLRARDAVRRHLLLTSNRLGKFFRPGALKPLAQACARGGVKATVLYSGLQEISDPQASQFARDAAACHIRLRPVRNPKVHAKILTWDDDCAVISSQNWLSADPGPTTLATELGVAIDSPGVGKLVRDRFNECLRDRGGRHRRSRSPHARRM